MSLFKNYDPGQLADNISHDLGLSDKINKGEIYIATC